MYFNNNRHAIKFLEMGLRNLACGVCGTILARKEDVFSVPGADGMVGAYVNSYGYVIHVSY